MSKATALIIEDHESNIMLYLDVLEMVDIELHVAKNGLDAINWLETHEPPTLILLDMNLPRYDGKQIYRHIRRNERFVDTRIVVNTADVNMADEIKKELVETDTLLMKPVNVSQLQQTAKAIVSAYNEKNPDAKSGSSIGRLWNKLRPKT